MPSSFEDRELLASFLGEQRGSLVEVRVAQRGEKRRMAELAAKNAQLALAHDKLMSQRTRARRIEALEELRESLNLESLPVRIECFDISNLGDANPVASMVVFEDAVAKRSDYRKFGMRHTGGQDDFAMMHEAVGRRFARMTTVDADAYDAQLRGRPEPGGDRRRQGPAGRRAGGDGRARPAARGRGLAGQAGGGGVRAGPVRSDPPAARLGRACSCCSGSATRPTGSRSGSTVSGEESSRSTRSSTRCPASDLPANAC